MGVIRGIRVPRSASRYLLKIASNHGALPQTPLSLARRREHQTKTRLRHTCKAYLLGRLVNHYIGTPEGAPCLRHPTGDIPIDKSVTKLIIFDGFFCGSVRAGS